MPQESEDAFDRGRVDLAGPARRLVIVVLVIVLAEAITFWTLAILDLLDLSSARLGSGIGIAVVLTGYGAALLLAGRLLLRGEPAARAPLIVAQLIQLLVAWNLRSDTALATAVAVPAAVALGCLLAPPVNRAFTVERR